MDSDASSGLTPTPFSYYEV